LHFRTGCIKLNEIEFVSKDNSMNDILFTKLFIPPFRPEGVPRSHLIARIDGHLTGLLTLLAAPAGYGKTSLLSAWASQHPESVAWISLDGGDNDLARWLSYLIGALRTVCSGIGEPALAMLASPKTLKAERILTALLNEISAWDQDLFLVLDDYHVISEPQIHHAVTYILDHMPPRMHLMIATRSDPPLPLARLRGRGELHELRAEDLQFSIEEVEYFLRKTFGMKISEADLLSLNRRTEGWITGLQMAALTLKDHEDPTAFIRDFAGDDRLVVDYLVEEVLSSLSEGKSHFLSCTGILEKLSGSLCDAVVYGDDKAGRSRELLESIESDHLFLMPLDNRRMWFRYHRLFADLLQKRLMQSHSEQLPELHGRASVWFEKHGYINEAVAHAFKAGDHDRAAALITQEAENTLMRSEVITLRRWIERLPEGHPYPDPQLYIYHAITLLLGGESKEVVEDKLREAERDLSQDNVRGELAALRAMGAMYRGEMDASVDYAEQALELLPKTSHFLRSLTVDSLGIAYIMLGRLEDALDILQEAIRVGQESGNILVAVGALSNVAGLLMNSGEMKQARELYTQALEMAQDSHGKPLPIAGKALMGLGEIAREWDDLESAEDYISQAIELLQYVGESGIVVSYLTLSRIFHTKGDVQGAFEMLEQAQELAVQSQETEFDDILVAIQRTRMHLSLGNLEEAVRWVEERDLDPSTIVGSEGREDVHLTSFQMLRLPEYTTLARILIAQGRFEEAQSVLKVCLSIAERSKQLRRIIECLILQAILLHRQGKRDSALQILEKALVLAEKHGYFRIFLEDGDELPHLIYEASERGIMPDFTGRLLAAHTRYEKVDEMPLSGLDQSDEIIEPLTERELDVLSLIVQGYTNQEIARELVLSLSTVKWHASNIYGKLGVKNRTQAVAKARQLGIVDAD
jgi:LuxR family maltose regulon positive regulatory protein